MSKLKQCVYILYLLIRNFFKGENTFDKTGKREINLIKKILESLREVIRCL